MYAHSFPKQKRTLIGHCKRYSKCPRETKTMRSAKAPSASTLGSCLPTPKHVQGCRYPHIEPLSLACRDTHVRISQTESPLILNTQLPLQQEHPASTVGGLLYVACQHPALTALHSTACQYPMTPFLAVCGLSAQSSSHRALCTEPTVQSSSHRALCTEPTAQSFSHRIFRREPQNSP